MAPIRLFSTARDSTHRLTELPPPPPAAADDPARATVHVDTRTRYQTIEGFGGAFTEAAVVILRQSPAALQQEVLKAYFDPQAGNGYTLCRTHINSCDFALGNYSYDEVAGDVELKHFTLRRDRNALLPTIKDAMAVAPGLKVFASPWSPPAWMKSNGAMNNGGKLKPEYRDVWARYFARYVKEYAKEGVPIWGVTVQNEPEAVQRWDSCIYTPEEERDFVRDHLGPALAAEGLAHVKIIIWDHNRDRMYVRAKAVLDDPKAAAFVWGVGFHWYVGDHFDNVQAVHDAWPDKKLLFTEGCQEGGPHLGEWELGERYGRSMINDLNRWTVGWVDWNLVLSELGGPNHVGNFCSAPIIIDTRKQRVLYQSSYYYIGHFSRFIRPGAVRVLSSSTHDELEVTAFSNPDGRIAVVVMNRSGKAVPYALRCGDTSAALESPAHGIQTVVVGG
jgi:glucosylceramidase